MPSHALHVCTYPGCHTLVRDGSRCALHARQADQARGSSTQRGYGYAWRMKRIAFLLKHPWCSDPFGDHPNQQVRATQVDHVVPKSEGGTDDESNLDGKCDHCHDKKTAMEDGGFGNKKKDKDRGYQ